MKVNRWGFVAVAAVAVVGTIVALSSCTTARVNAGQTPIIVDYVLIPTDPISGYPSIDDYLRAKAIEAGQNPYQPTYVVPQAG